MKAESSDLVSKTSLEDTTRGNTTQDNTSTTQRNTRQHKYNTRQHETTRDNTSTTRDNTSVTRDNTSTKQRKIYFDLFISSLHTRSLVY